MADLAFDHLQAPDERFVGGAAGVRFGAEARGNALVARNEFGQILADELADIGGRWGRWIECLELRGEQVELNADAVDELAGRRSEEHTSELQSLMRNSYAGSCLKKKN